MTWGLIVFIFVMALVLFAVSIYRKIDGVVALLGLVMLIATFVAIIMQLS